MLLNNPRCAALFLFFSFIFPLILSKADAALLPEEQRKMQEAFLKAADVTAVISLSKVEQEFLCGVKSLFKASCECVSVYRIKEVISQPQGFLLKIGDTMILEYPCDKDKKKDKEKNKEQPVEEINSLQKQIIKLLKRV